VVTFFVKSFCYYLYQVVPWDISIETTEPKIDLLPRLITDKTVAILVAHIYGKWCDMDPIIDVAQPLGIHVIEDCAECFCGFDLIGNPRSDLALFSFGVIKNSTAFGGAIAKVKDKSVVHQMEEAYQNYPVQSHREYLKRILKYYIVYLVLLPYPTQFIVSLSRLLGVDHKAVVVSMLRGFPDQMVQRIKSQPSAALLHMMRERFAGFNREDFDAGTVKGIKS